MAPQFCMVENSVAFAPLRLRLEITKPPFPAFSSVDVAAALLVPAS
jgi:hypothetical protein